MDVDETEPRFIISVVDPTNVWGLVSDVLLSRLPFRHVHLKNKFGNLVPISELHLQYLNHEDALLRKRRPHAKQPVTWFRNPYAHLILVSGENVDDYKQNVRDGLRRMLDPPVDPLGGPVEWIIVYVRPSTIDPQSKGPGKVFAALRNDFSTRRRERCMRLDFSGGLVTGVDDLERQLRDMVKSTFEARAAAYEEEVRRLMAMRKAEGWRFSTLFLVKDSLAAMLEAAGCLEDALREYSEMEACYSEAISSGGDLAAQPFGGNEEGDDQACLLSVTWREIRHSVFERGALPQFRFRQFLFACQARILFKLQRHTEVAERGLNFVATFGELMADAQLPPLLREAWSFSACMSLVITLARLAPGAPAPGPSTLLPPSVSDAGHQINSAAGTAAQREGRPLHRSQSAGDLGDSPDRKNRGHGSASPSAHSVASSTTTAAYSEISEGSSLRLEALRAQRPVLHLPQRPSRLDQSVVRSRLGNAGGGQTNGPGDSLPARPSDRKKPRTDWQLGLSLAYDAELLEEAGQVVAAAAAKGGSLAPDPASRQFWCALGNLYAAARTEAMRIGHGAALGPDTADSLVLMNGASPISAPGQRSPVALRHDSSASVATTNGSTAPATPVNTDLAQRLSRFSPFDTAIGFRARHSRNRSDATDSSARSLSATPQDSFSVFRAEPSAQSVSVRSESFASDSAELPISSAAKGDFYSMTGPVDKTSLRARSHGDEIGALAEESSVSGSQGDDAADARSKSEADLAAAGLGRVKGGLDPSDPRFIENEVETGSESSMPHTPEQARASGPLPFGHARDGGGHSGSAANLEWLSDWRLKAALSSKQEFQDLWLELSRCAAMCYRRGGRRRNAALLRLEVAEALSAAGSTREAVSLLSSLVQEVLHEGWLSIAAALLARLLDCSHPLTAADKAPICIRLLSLAERLDEQEARAVQAELVAAATGLTRAAPLPGPLSNLRLPSGHTDALCALWVQPVPGKYGQFFGESASPGVPIMTRSHEQPSDGAGIAGSGVGVLHKGASQQSSSSNSMEGSVFQNDQTKLANAESSNGSSGGPASTEEWRGFDGCLGDVTDAEIEVVSSLPAPLQVTDVTITISIMQEVSVPLSSVTAVTPSTLGRPAGGSPFEAALDGGAPLTGRLRSTPRTYSEAGDLSPRPRMCTMWQEVEEISCCLAAPGSQPQVADSATTLQPGANRLLFGVAVMKQGLYVLKHAHCRIGRMTLQLRAALPDEKGPPVEALTMLPPLAAAVTDQQGPGSAPAFGAVDFLGKVREAAVLLHALACQPRLRLSAVAYTGALVAGHASWLGIALEPLHDRLNNLQLHVAPADVSGFNDPWATASSSMSGASWGSRAANSQRDGSGARMLAQATCRIEVLEGPVQMAPIWGSEPDEAHEQGGTPLEAVSRASSTGERQEGGWMEVRQRSSSGGLPAWAADRPSLLWLRVQAGDLPIQVESVRVALHSEHSFGPPKQQTQQGAVVQTADVSGCTEMNVNVEYMAGCQRSHAARLAIPVTPPFRLRLVARELADKRVVVQTRVTSMLAWQATITQATMSAPAGYEVQPPSPALSALFPLQVPPGASVLLLHFLDLKHKVSRLARSSASTLQLHFTLDAEQQGHERPRQVSNGWLQPHLPPQQLSFPPTLPQRGADDGSGTSKSAGRAYLLSHKFVLETNDVAETPRSIVAVQLLGPFSARVGELVTFCWRLERMGSVGVPSEVAPLITYEAVADGDAWAPAAPCFSQIALPSQAGAFATVEASWTALRSGPLPVAQLRLCDVAQKDIYDGEFASTIMCQA